MAIYGRGSSLRRVSKRVSTVATELRCPELAAIQAILTQFDCEFGQWQAQFEALLDETAEELRSETPGANTGGRSTRSRKRLMRSVRSDVNMTATS